MSDTATKTEIAAVPRLIPAPKVEIYHKTWCGYSRAALRLLGKKGVAFEPIDVTDDAGLEREMIRRAGGRTSVPQIFVDNELIGGYDELKALDDDGLLDGLLGVGDRLRVA